MTNSIPLIQLAAQHVGYQLSGAEIGMALTLTGTLAAAVTHAAHLAVNGWRRVGGWEGLRNFLKNGT
jgi:hypothetical protein